MPEGLFSRFPAWQPWGEGSAAAGMMSRCLPRLASPLSCTQNLAAGEPGSSTGVKSPLRGT